MDDESDRRAGGPSPESEPRVPEEADLVLICRRLNELGAKYVVVGGFAMIYGGYPRTTTDIDLVLATDLENEALVYQALEILPDRAVRELRPGEVAKYIVVRVADEVVVDLMRSASGIHYEEAAKEVIIRNVQGVPIPFASPRLLWRMKARTHREKDAGDLVFLREYFKARGEEPPSDL